MTLFKIIKYVLVFVLLLNSCSSDTKKPNLDNIQSTITDIIDTTDINVPLIKDNIKNFRSILKKRKPLSENDLQIYDFLFQSYLKLKYRPQQKAIQIPTKTKLILNFKSYCLSPDKAIPEPNEKFKLSKIDNKLTNNIPYFQELLSLSEQKKYPQELIQELIWNIQNKTYWELYPEQHKNLLKTIDIHAEKKFPHKTTEEIKSLVIDEISQHLSQELNDSYEFIKGSFYDYQSIKTKIESLRSKQDLDQQNIIPVNGILDLYSSSVSKGFQEQKISFYNTSNTPILIDLHQYQLEPLRTDVQKIAIYSEDNNYLNDFFKELELLLYSDMAKYGYNFVPGLNDLIDLYEVTTGTNFFTSETLSTQDRFLSALALLAGNAETYRNAAKILHGPASYIDESFKKYRQIKNEANYKTLEKLSKELHHKGIPDEWAVKASRSNKKSAQGLEFIHPENPNTRIRVMPGNPQSPHSNSQSTYVKVQKDGLSVDKNGNITQIESNDNHIPFDEFDFSIFKDILK